MFSNSLKQLAKFLTDTEKMENEGWDLWVKVHGRDKDAQEIMEAYCMQDVETLDKIFLRLRPFVVNMPNQNMFRRDGVRVCPNCGGFRLKTKGQRATKTKLIRRFLCSDCGTYSHTDIKDNIKVQGNT